MVFIVLFPELRKVPGTQLEFDEYMSSVKNKYINKLIAITISKIC